MSQYNQCSNKKRGGALTKLFFLHSSSLFLKKNLKWKTWESKWVILIVAHLNMRCYLSIGDLILAGGGDGEWEILRDLYSEWRERREKEVNQKLEHAKYKERRYHYHHSVSMTIHKRLPHDETMIEDINFLVKFKKLALWWCIAGLLMCIRGTCGWHVQLHAYNITLLASFLVLYCMCNFSLFAFFEGLIPH